MSWSKSKSSSSSGTQASQYVSVSGSCAAYSPFYDLHSEDGLAMHPLRGQAEHLGAGLRIFGEPINRDGELPPLLSKILRYLQSQAIRVENIFALYVDPSNKELFSLKRKLILGLYLAISISFLAVP